MPTPEINLQNPFQARRWLRLLKEDDDVGFLLKPNARLPKRSLGFSYATNPLGLHGPSNQNADTVVFGTSYALSIAVDERDNWFDTSPRFGDWLNLGLPVGIREWRELQSRYYQGSHKQAVLVYHPNIWAHCLMYERWRASGLGLFKALRWSTGWMQCARLALRKWRQRRHLKQTRELLFLKHHGRHFEFDTNYAYFDPVKESDILNRNLAILVALLQGFEQKLVIRVPIKQELAAPRLGSDRLQRLISNYDQLWQATCQALGRLPNLEIETPQGFELAHYHPRDTHWNAQGNRAFGSWLAQRLPKV